MPSRPGKLILFLLQFVYMLDGFCQMFNKLIPRFTSSTSTLEYQIPVKLSGFAAQFCNVAPWKERDKSCNKGPYQSPPCPRIGWIVSDIPYVPGNSNDIRNSLDDQACWISNRDRVVGCIGIPICTVLYLVSREEAPGRWVIVAVAEELEATGILLVTKAAGVAEGALPGSGGGEFRPEGVVAPGSLQSPPPKWSARRRS